MTSPLTDRGTRFLLTDETTIRLAQWPASATPAPARTTAPRQPRFASSPPRDAGGAHRQVRGTPPPPAGDSGHVARPARLGACANSVPVKRSEPRKRKEIVNMRHERSRLGFLTFIAAFALSLAFAAVASAVQPLRVSSNGRHLI